MAINIKFTKFDNTPWGFRLAGGSDFLQSLTVIKVTEGGLAECMGLKIGDVVVRLNDQSISSLTHGQAHETFVHAGNNFILGVQREEEARKATEAISEENIVPYKIALADLPPVFPEQILKEETVIERYEEKKTVIEPLSAEDEIKQEEEKLAEEKPVDANSEIVPNKNLTDDEIAQLILEEEELLSNKGLLGVNFKKLRPRAPILKGSKVLEELQHIATAEPERVQELKRTSTFLQKPQRPVPKLKNEKKVEEDEGETYKVVIKKQDKKTVITRLVEKGLLAPGSEATIARTPESPESSEVKMHEMENRLEESRPPVVSDSNSSCSTCTLDNTDGPLLSPRPPEFDSSEFLPSEDQLTRHTTYAQCKSKLFYVKPQFRRHSSVSRHDEATARSSFKGRYLENVLRGYARSCIFRDRQIDARLDEFAKDKSGSGYFRKYDWLKNIGLDGEIRTKTSRCARAHYAERILLQNVSAVTKHFRSKPKTTRVFVARIKGRYLATYLRRESIRLMSLMMMLFQFLLQRPGVSELSNMSKSHERRLSFKGRYFEHVLQKNVTPIFERVKETCIIYDQPKVIEEKKDEPKSTRTKGHYVEKYLHRRNLRLRYALMNLLDYSKNSFDNLFAVATSSRVKRTTKGRYLERLIRRNLEIFELFVKYVRSRISEWLGEDLSCISRNEFPVVNISTSNCIADDSIPNELEQTDEGASDLKISEWHKDGPSCPLQKESLLIVNTSDNLDLNEEETCEEKSGRNILEWDGNQISFEEANKRPDSAEPTDTIPEDENTLSKFLQSAENYVSTEVFHRGSRRLSRSRKSIDILSKEGVNSFSKFLQSAEDYVSAKVFHRGSRRFSRSLKREEREENVLSSVLRSTGDYVSSEVFHRGNRILLRSSRRESVFFVTPGLWDSLKSVHFNLPWFSFRVSEKSTECSGEKINLEIERDNRRLSFVPTILYQGITNHIGIDFTRLVVYAFVPCTSIVLLYMYK